ncbi:ribose 5-phosphate isomerase B [candidate division WOR-1 bacterium RIFOXYD2_FULL_36_8]|nr:MAG: ribose 5-phosphate isomerase B [candidate division WOR-1 bacterium RIFOXYD2_FULL_36_8]
MKIAVGSDHAGFELKEKIKNHLLERGFKVKDFGTNSKESCDYPDFAYLVASAVAKGAFEIGILLCGSGVGVSITANKVKGIRAVNAYSEEIAKQSREHGDCNILTLAGRDKYLDPKMALKIVDVWLDTLFSGEERHQKRIRKIEKE